MRHQRLQWLTVMLALATLAGCSRGHYRYRADVDAYSLVEEKSYGQPWMPPSDYTIYPHPASRLFFDSPLDDPALPIPAPQLYAYDLPDLPQRDPNRFYRPSPASERLPDVPEAMGMAYGPGTVRRLPVVARAGRPQLVSYRDSDATAVRQALYRLFEEDPSAIEAAPLRSIEDDIDQRTAESGELAVAPIPVAAWEAIPPECRVRMFDFQSLLQEAELTRRAFGRDVTQVQSDAAQRLTLEDIVELALMNSREYQTQKEVLYRTALVLSLSRFDYQLRFAPNGHQTNVSYTHNRNGGITVNNLSVPTTVTAQKLLLTGGDLLARFANNVLLTFNGPQGFAADVGSDLLLEISQPIFQRDVGFESLTQTERNVVYAAREFARFRKEFFVDLAAQYYSLILTFRNVEISAQNYFSLAREFNRTEAEFEGGFVSRVQLDQVEQNLLTGRNGLIQTCNGLEQSLDSLKIRIGLPTETPINIDLTELNQLTRRDELAVTGNLIGRVRRRLLNERSVGQDAADDEGAPRPDRVQLLSTSIVLIDRILEADAIQRELGLPPLNVEPLRLLRAQMQVEIWRLTAREIRIELDRDIANIAPSLLPIILQRSLALVDTLVNQVDRQLALALVLSEDQQAIDMFRAREDVVIRDANLLREQLQEIIRTDQLDLLPNLVEQGGVLRAQAEQLVAEIDQFNGYEAFPPDMEVEEIRQLELDQTIADVDRLLAEATRVAATIGGGLIPIEIDVDDAMLTALTLRFDLMNRRGLLADDWRQIKYAGDALKSVLNVSAGQEVRTRADVNRPFDFTWDESRTALGLAFSTPLNRRAQRNTFRNRLIDYQLGLRNLTQLEDNIKFAVRNDLRNLALDREQFVISVASAALAFERVVSTQLEFRLGTGGVAARDFLEAQTAYAESLSAVASRHIGYIVDRTQLFLDLELLTVGENGFWAELYNEEYQPEPYYQLPPWAMPVYGDLPYVWYSKRIRRLLQVPPGNAMIHDESVPLGESVPEGEPALEPLPAVPTPPPAPLPAGNTY